jgi:predicted permease
MRFRHILRRLLHVPVFTAVAVATLAIGIGSNSAIFSVIEGVLLKPLPFPHADELVSVDHAAPGINIGGAAGSAPFLYFTYRDEGRVFDDIALWRTSRGSVTGLAEPEEVRTLEVTAGFLGTLGVQPAAGRRFSEKDDAPGSPETVMLTAGYWRARFGGDPSAIGRRLMVDGRAREIIGVLPATFHFLDTTPMLVEPMQLDRSHTFLGNFSYQSIARLKPGVTLQAADADLARMIPIALGRYPAFPGFSPQMFVEARLGPALRPLKASLIGDIGTVLWVLMGTIGLVLLIACANVANLLLVRAEGRQQELAIRAALGAGWARIARELLVESLTLGAFGGVAGLALAYGAVRVLIGLAPGNLPRLSEISIDGTVLLFTVGISLLAGLLFGLFPVIKYAGPHLAASLRSQSRSASQSKERHRARSTLVVVQVALALVLLVSAGLMIRTFEALRRVEPGFTRPEQVQTLRLSIPESQVKDAELTIRMEQAMVDRIAAIPGVSSVSATSTLPMTNSGWHDAIFADDHVYAESKIPPLRSFRFVLPGLFQAMGNTIVVGRDITWTDVYDKRAVALVSENLSRELWSDPRAAIGHRIRETPKSAWREIIGVVRDQRDDGVSAPAPATVYWPALMTGFEGGDPFVMRTPSFVVRTARAGTSGLVTEINRAVWAVNPDVPVASVRTLQEIYAGSLARTSFTLVMLGIAGAMALLLGVAGIYGVIAYAVTQRTREIGIRMALGAQQEEVRRMFVGHGLRLAAIGVGCGLVAALALARLMSSLLYNVNPLDPVTYALVAVGLVGAATLASYVPARRATSVDPVEALRAE